jgi:hypothetical protein
MLVLMPLVMIATLLPVATSVTYASGYEAVEEFAYYLCQYFGC